MPIVLALSLILAALRATELQGTPVPPETWAAFIAWARTQASERIRLDQVLQNYGAHLEAQQPSARKQRRHLRASELILKDFFKRATPEQREWDLLSGGRFYASRPQRMYYRFLRTLSGHQWRRISRSDKSAIGPSSGLLSERRMAYFLSGAQTCSVVSIGKANLMPVQ
jgi:hypothetical protein